MFSLLIFLFSIVWITEAAEVVLFDQVVVEHSILVVAVFAVVGGTVVAVGAVADEFVRHPSIITI